VPDNCQFWHSEKNIKKSKNHWVQLYQKPQKKRTHGFHERTTKAPAIFFRHLNTLFDFFKSSVLVSLAHLIRLKAARPQTYADPVLLVFPLPRQGYCV
jgi:hypothetical protein